jgi:hypothetical protein
MPRRHQGKSIAAAVALAAALAPAARADACIDEGTAVLLGIGALLTPADIGVAVPAAAASSPRLVIGWSWQIPLTGGALDTHPGRHRVVPEVDLLPLPAGVSLRGRFGYRYARRHLFAGAGVGLDGAGPNLSPELGVRFAHFNTGDDDIDTSMHLLARAELAPETGVRGATILLGWNLF